VLHHQEGAEQVAVEDVLRVLVGHLCQRAADLQSVVEDDDVDSAEGFSGLVCEVFDERLLVEVSRDVQVLGLGAVELLPAAGKQQAGTFAAEMGTYCLPDSAAGTSYHGGCLIKSHICYSFGKNLLLGG
jgi:hypothetical protein